MASYLWPGDPGWPAPPDDEARDPVDPTGEIDLDALSLRAPPPHLWDDLTALERDVVASHYGLDGRAERSMKELHDDLGLTRHQVRDALESGLAKLRAHLVA